MVTRRSTGHFAKGTEPASDCPSHKRGFFKRLFTKKNKRKANTL
jgi:hypothetical protein